MQGITSFTCWFCYFFIFNLCGFMLITYFIWCKIKGRKLW
jgi:hypothetical protein